ncbi:MAG: [FeFe] hydrogenase H-cluster radical SAM maturase HydG [Halanaerobiaceae bacterium]
MEDFINDEEIKQVLKEARDPEPEEVRSILAKAADKNRLQPHETAKLLQVKDPELLDEMYSLAKKLKESVYGNRIVFFAPLYIGNKCINNCHYCAFRLNNDAVERKTLTKEELKKEVEVLIDRGQKRLILVFGEHPDYSANFICQTIKTVYRTKKANGEIRRVNINAAPLEVEDYKKLHRTGIGTYQIFQETYHHETYRQVHPADGPKSDYTWRLTGLDRAMEAGIDDVGIGALFGLYDWKFEVMGLLYHTIHLEEKYGVGPHTISFPRLEPAINTPFQDNLKYKVSDSEFKKLVAIIRLSVPYTGLILTAREDPEIRREVIPLGISQIDAGSRIAIGGYRKADKGNIPEKEQFHLGDARSLDRVIRETCKMGCVPSFCTAGYRCGRTGEQFMNLARPGKVHKYCMPNALLTFKEYLLDYASDETRKIGEKLIEKNIRKLSQEKPEQEKFLRQKLKKVEQGQRDVYV